MGKHKFRLSHMIPNAWFYRLRDMNTAATGTAITAAHKQKPLPSAYSSRTSICHTPILHKSYTSPKPNFTTTINLNNPPSPKCPLGAIYTDSTHHFDRDMFLSPCNTYYESPLSSESTQSSLDRDRQPPSSTTSNSQSSISNKIVKENISKKQNPGRRRVSGIKIRSKKSWKTAECKRDEKKASSISSSNCCIVKSTFKPEKDLKESMVEMIVENKIGRDSKDLERLLACYLSLNSSEYHDMIVRTFEEIWLTFDFGV